MSTEHNHYRASCNACGHEGVWVEHSDDWGRGGRTFEGFDMVPPDPQAVLRKRTGAQDMTARCPQCGGRDIQRGDFIKST